MRFDPVQIVTDGDMSQATINSIGIDLNQTVLYSVQAVFTGTPTGTLKLQISNDVVKVAPGTNPSANVVNWSDYTGSSQSISAAGNFTWNCFDVGYRWVRLVYVRASGSGTLNATYCGKGI